jgi:hypothetical protein
MGSKSNQLEKDTRARQGLAAGRETELYGLAKPGYEEFAKTGGISPEEEGKARTSVSHGVSSQYGRLKEYLTRRRAIQGGYAPGFGASQAKVARQSANATGEALTNLDANLLAQRREGRLQGLGGLEGMRSGYAGEQQGLLGTRLGLEQKRRGVLGNISAGIGVAGDALSLGKKVSGMF